MPIVIFVIFIILLSSPTYAIDKHLQMKGINELRKAGLCTSTKVLPKESPYCIVSKKVCKKLGKLGGKYIEEICLEGEGCEWEIDNYAEGIFLKVGELSHIIFVEDDDSCSCHANGLGYIVFISGPNVEIFKKDLDTVDFVKVLKGKDGKDRLLIEGGSTHQGVYTRNIFFCDFKSLPKKDFYKEGCKSVGFIQGGGDIRDNKENIIGSMYVNLEPLPQKSENVYEFELEITKEYDKNRLVKSKKCYLKYKWDGINLISSLDNKKCLDAAEKFLNM